MYINPFPLSSTPTTCARQIPKAQQGNGSNHAVSAMKFRILKEFLQLGYSVFLSGMEEFGPGGAMDRG